MVRLSAICRRLILHTLRVYQQFANFALVLNFPLFPSLIIFSDREKKDADTPMSSICPEALIHAGELTARPSTLYLSAPIIDYS